LQLQQGSGEIEAYRKSRVQLRRFIKRKSDLDQAHDVKLLKQDTAGKIRIYSTLISGTCPPLSLGMMLARAKVWNQDMLSEYFDLHPRWLLHQDNVTGLPTEPAIYLLSDYIWSHDKNLALSQRIKAHSPRSIIIHGGPDCPTYMEDAERYFRDHPYIDITVRGEGEQTLCELLAAIGPNLAQGHYDPEVLEGVSGLYYRKTNGVMTRTENRQRMSDLNDIPSPFLDGTFTAFEDEVEIELAVIETNRGCPYGCTFCDWGSATKSKIRRFDMDRVLAEFDWCARNKVKRIFVADANFGIFPRDVQIAEHVAKLKQETGYPERFITNYAKNSVKHLKKIVEIVSSAGILTEGLLSLQTMDDDTLTAIRRSNIKTSSYDDLASEFRTEGLPLYVDLMMGLPGQTLESLRADFQQCVDREVLAKCHGTELLVNSPMNDPGYREDYEIVASRSPSANARAVTRDCLVILYQRRLP